MADPGMPVPADFAETERLSFHSKVQTKFVSRSPDIGKQFNEGLGGLLYRFTACTEHDETFTASVIKDGPGPSQPQRYHQDRELFEFFVTGQSAIECLCYSLYALGEMVQPTSFCLLTKGKPQRIDPESTRDAYQKAFGSQSLTGNLVLVIGSKEYAEWTEARNILIHRAHPGRHFGMKSGPGSFTLNAPALTKSLEAVVKTEGGGSWTKWMVIPIDALTTRSRREWLARQIRTLLAEADAFVDHLV